MENAQSTLPDYWRPGRGALGQLKPLLGNWVAEAVGPDGASLMQCTREFRPVLNNAYIQLNAAWVTGPDRRYEELALFGKGAEGLVFHSFTSDGKRSHGAAADAPDVDPYAIAFEADMPAGRARMVYWPAGDGAFFFAVESRTQKGWKRFMQHRYTRLPG